MTIPAYVQLELDGLLGPSGDPWRDNVASLLVRLTTEVYRERLPSAPDSDDFDLGEHRNQLANVCGYLGEDEDEFPAWPELIDALHRGFCRGPRRPPLTWLPSGDAPPQETHGERSCRELDGLIAEAKGGDAPQEPSACGMCEGRPVRRLCLDDRDALVDWLNEKSASGWNTHEVDMRTGVAECRFCTERHDDYSMGVIRDAVASCFPSITPGQSMANLIDELATAVYKAVDLATIEASRPPGAPTAAVRVVPDYGKDDSGLAPGEYAFAHGYLAGPASTRAAALKALAGDLWSEGNVLPGEDVDASYFTWVQGEGRPPGGAEPVEDMLRCLRWIASRPCSGRSGETKCHEFIEDVHQWCHPCYAKAASEGAAPPPQTEETREACSECGLWLEVAAVGSRREATCHTCRAVWTLPEPSGVPDAPGWWWLFEGGNPWRPVFVHGEQGGDLFTRPNGDGAGWPIENRRFAWGGPVAPRMCTPDADAGKAELLKLCDARLEQLWDALGREKGQRGTWGGAVQQAASYRREHDESGGADAGTLEALRGAESDLRRIAEMFGDEQGNAVELAAEHAGLRGRLRELISHWEENGINPFDVIDGIRAAAQGGAAWTATLAALEVQS